MSTSHTVSGAFTNVNHASPMLFIGLAMVFIVMLQRFIPDKLSKWGFTLI
jgi:hypothetical protein